MERVRSFLFLQLCFLAVSGSALWADSMLVDLNGDGQVFYMGFGDSITWGRGDGTQPGQTVDEPPRTDGSMGYVARVGAWLGIVVRNAGQPGERLVDSGEYRFPATLLSSGADFVGVMEGVNDSFKKLSAHEYEYAYERMANTATALGKQIIFLTIPMPCCDHSGIRPFVAIANDQARRVASWNGLPVADVDRAWGTTCQNQGACELFCRPDGLHPNSKGYDVIAQVVVATLLGIDIFAPDGAAQLEGALGWPAGSVIVKPSAL